MSFYDVFNVFCYSLIMVGAMVFYYFPRARRCVAARVRRPSRPILAACFLIAMGAAYNVLHVFGLTETPHQSPTFRGGMALTVVAALADMAWQNLRRFFGGSHRHNQGASDATNAAVPGLAVNTDDRTDEFIIPCFNGLREP